MTKQRESKLQTTQRKMLRWIVGTKRYLVRADGRSDTDSDEFDGAEPTDTEDEEFEHGELVLEDWVHYISRATRIAEDLFEKANLSNWVVESRRRKWRWAGHVARRHDHRWSHEVLQWTPAGGCRNQGGQRTRWVDDINAFFKFHFESAPGEWIIAAQDPSTWKEHEDKFALDSNFRFKNERKLPTE